MGAIRAVVFIGMNPWEHSAINDSVRFLAAACTKVDCLYIEPPLGLRGAMSNPGRLLHDFHWEQKVYRQVTVYTPPLGFAPVGLGLRKHADHLNAATFARTLERLYGASWREQTLVYISSWSYTQTYFIKSLRPKHLVFHILDDSLAFPEIENHPRVLAENKLFYRYLMTAGSVIIAVSQELADKYSRLYHREVQLLKNGVNVKHFWAGDLSEPVDMQTISKPVLMYTGSINSWIDLDLLARLADDRPGYSLVLIGHYYEGSTNADQWRELLAKTNVHWLKSKPYAMLPAYLQHAAALILPRTQDEHSLASDPLKLYEYLSTGKPVISTALPAVDDFREFVYVAGQEDFTTQADRALKEQNQEKAQRQSKMMEKHSWSARLSELADMCLLHCGVTF